MTYLVECTDCHLLVLSAYQGATRCAYCSDRAVKRAEADERLWRNRERHHNPERRPT